MMNFDALRKQHEPQGEVVRRFSFLPSTSNISSSMSLALGTNCLLVHITILARIVPPQEKMK